MTRRTYILLLTLAALLTLTAPAHADVDAQPGRVEVDVTIDAAPGTAHHDPQVEQRPAAVIPVCTFDGDAYLDTGPHDDIAIYIDGDLTDDLLIPRERLPATIIVRRTQDGGRIGGPWTITTDELGRQCDDRAATAADGTDGELEHDTVDDEDNAAQPESDIPTNNTRADVTPSQADIPQPTRIDSGTGGHRTGVPPWALVLAAIGSAVLAFTLGWIAGQRDVKRDGPGKRAERLRAEALDLAVKEQGASQYRRSPHETVNCARHFAAYLESGANE